MSIFEQLNEFNNIICQLISIGSKLEKKDKTPILLSLLFSSYEHFMTIFLYGKDSIDLEEVIAALLSNKMRKMGVVGEVQAEAEVLVACVKTKEKGFDRSYQDFECHYRHKN